MVNDRLCLRSCLSSSRMDYLQLTAIPIQTETFRELTLVELSSIVGEQAILDACGSARLI